jgi:hypothetical protein
MAVRLHDLLYGKAPVKANQVWQTETPRAGPIQESQGRIAD